MPVCDSAACVSRSGGVVDGCELLCGITETYSSLMAPVITNNHVQSVMELDKVFFGRAKGCILT